MNPNYRHTITIFNCLKAVNNPDEKKDKWYKTTLGNVYYKAKVSRVESGKELGMANSYTVRIPKSDQYIPYLKWAMFSEEERDKYYTLRIDDIVVCGESKEIITGEAGNTASEVLFRNKTDAFKVMAISDNTAFPIDGHYRLGG